ncbi:MAG TPA: hypothetical protein VFL57_05415, partial [Bryobacteraceae bacterium]|nr:hypothetical protein [Bryobacteraceae bacterium]
AGRVIRRHLDRTIRGNTYVQFETGLRAIGIGPGDIITLTWLKDGFERQPFRVLKIAPGQNYETTVITAQLHDDDWYSDEPVPAGLVPNGRRETPFGSDVPRPLSGDIVSEDGSSEFTIREVASANADGTHSITLEASFLAPARPSVNGPGVPVVSLAPAIGVSGGTLKVGSTYYYAVSGCNANGEEGELSFIVRAEMPAGPDTGTVRLKGLQFGAGTSTFNVYRGKTPAQLSRVAAGVPVAPEYVDAGGAVSGGSPPDANYHHANFYWRLELVPACAAQIATAITIGNNALALTANEFRGKLVRILSGTGSGQERTASSNTATTLTVAPAWTIVPDATSRFAVCEAGWQFGALAYSSPATIQVPNREAAVVQVSGRAASVQDKESPEELSPVTRWTIGGVGAGEADSDVSGVPYFGLSAPGRGIVEVGAIAFESLQNTKSIRAGTLTLQYVDEIASGAIATLRGDLEAASTEMSANGAAWPEGTLIVVDAEILRVTGAGAGGSYIIERGTFGTMPARHVASTRLHELRSKTIILPFVAGFFGSPASGGYSYPIELPNVRVVAAELFMTNSVGNSQTAAFAFTATTDKGLRTLSGGQLTLQVHGFLAIQSAAVPPLSIDAARSVRDVFATLGRASTGGPVRVRVTVNTQPYCDLEIPAGERISNVVSGTSLPALRERDELGLDILSVSQSPDSTPGGDLTVTVRL